MSLRVVLLLLLLSTVAAAAAAAAVQVLEDGLDTPKNADISQRLNQEETCESADAHYQQLAAKLHQASAENATIALAATQDSSRIRDQSYKKSHRHQLDLSQLNHILELDNSSLTVKVQGKVTMDDLVQYTLRHNAIPAVATEFKSITVAGAIVGGALESSSFKHGQVSDSIVECVLLLANGTLATISPSDHPDLYDALPGSYGSIGIVLEATLRLVDVPPPGRVRVTTTTFESSDEGINALTGMSLTQQHDFLDALYFPNGKLVVMTGELAALENKVSSTPHIEMRSCSLWFSEQIEDRIHDNVSDTSPPTFTMSIYDYLFRYDYGAFWMARPLKFSWAALRREPKLAGPFLMASRHARKFFGHLYTTTNLYRVLHQLDQTAVAERFVILDAYMPASNTTEYLDYIHTTLPTSIPIWLCPVKPPHRPQPLSPSGRLTTDNMLINVAVWGRVSDIRGIDYVTAMEGKMLELGGRKMLYSQTNMTTEALYHQHVDGSAYTALRKKYDPQGLFPPLHEKLQLRSRDENGSHGEQKQRRSLKYWISRMLL